MRGMVEGHGRNCPPSMAWVTTRLPLHHRRGSPSPKGGGWGAFWQHPPGQVVASQTHTPPVHFWVALHAAPAPQWQLPSAAHESDFVTSHTEHDEPLSPHAVSDFG